MSLPFLLQCRPASVQGAGSKLRSGGAGSKASYGGGRSSLDQTASQKDRCKRSLSALSEHPVEHVPWKEMFGVEDDDGSALESVKLKCVGVVGLQGSLATELVDCFSAKPSIVNVGVHLGSQDGTCSKFDIMPGVTTLPTAHEVCAWSDIIFLCGSYEDASNFLRTQDSQKALKGKVVLQLGSGTPEEAVRASNLAKTAGARYLDAFVFSEGTANVFNHRLSAMMVSGDKKAWREVEGVVRAAAPASFYGGRRVEWANAVGVGVVTFLASVRMGLNQAQNITTKLGLPNHVLPRVLNSGYLTVVKALVSAAATIKPSHQLFITSRKSLQTNSALPAAPSSSNTFSDIHGANSECMPELSCTSSGCASPSLGATSPSTAATASAAATPAVGSEAWILQLEKIRDVCQKAQVDHTLIDGFLAASGAPQQLLQPQMNAFVPLSSAFAVSHVSETPIETDCDQKYSLEVEGSLLDVFGRGGSPERLDFDVHEALMDTDMLRDECLMAAWAP